MYDVLVVKKGLKHRKIFRIVVDDENGAGEGLSNPVTGGQGREGVRLVHSAGV